MKYVFPPMVPVSAASAVGILAGSMPAGTAIPACLAPLVLMPVICISGFPGRKMWVILLCLVLCATGAFRMHRIRQPDLPPHHISHYYGKAGVTIVGRIASFARHNSYRTRQVLDCRFLVSGDTKPGRIPVTGRVHLNLYGKGDGRPGYGDWVAVPAIIKPIRNFANPGGFDYVSYLKQRKIFGSVHAGAAEVERLPPTDPPWYLTGFQRLESLRNAFVKFCLQTLDHSGAAQILSALVTGKKETVPNQIRDLYARAGTSHILAISGLHLSILALFCFHSGYAVLSRFPGLVISGAAKKWAGLLMLPPLLVYTCFTGFSPSTQRAFIMAAVFIFSFLIERETDPVNTFCVAGTVILIRDPPALFSLSFQLSFCAVFFIILGFRLLPRRFFSFPLPVRWPVSACMVTLFAGLGTFPLIARYFNLVSLVQIPANLIVVPLMGFISLPLGLAGLLLFGVAPEPARLCLVWAEHPIAFCSRYLSTLTELPFAWIRVSTISLTELVLIYTALASVYCLVRYKKKPISALVCGSVIVIFFWQRILFSGEPSQKMTVTILDVGQGNSAVIRTIEGKTILVDGGGFSGGAAFDVGRYVVAPFLWRQRVRALDAVILTHPEADHMKGLLFVLENFRIGCLVKNREVSTQHDFRRLMAICKNRHIPVWIPDCEKDRIAYDRTRLIFFQCGTLQPDFSVNDNSLVFKLELNHFSMLFPGDVLARREQALVADPPHPLSADILLSPHHGSISSSNKFFLDKIHPERVIISCGFNNRYGFPHPTVLNRYRERGIGILRTDVHGAVTVTSDGEGYELETLRGG